MKNKLSFKDYIYISCMLFGMVFGAGSLIFLMHMGQLAGSNFWSPLFGFLITGVGLPLLGVAALGIRRSNVLYDLAIKVSKKYSFFYLFTLLNYWFFLCDTSLCNYSFYSWYSTDITLGSSW